MFIFRNLTVLFSLLIFLNPLAIAQNSPESSQENVFVMCRLGKIVRTIRVVNLQEGGCETLYSKGGRDRSVGQSSRTLSCVSFLNNVRNNLEKASWKCKEIQGVTVSYLLKSTSINE